jgi:hypothetical protein
MNKTKDQKYLKSFVCFLCIIILFSPFFFFFISFNNVINSNYRNDKLIKDNNEINPEISATWGWLILTSNEIDGKRYYSGIPIVIKGRLYHKPTDTGYVGYNVSLIIDGNSITQNNNITGLNGSFQIGYIIPDSLNIYSGHIIEAEVNNPGGGVIMENNFTIYTNTTSTLIITNNSDITNPYLTGETFNVQGELRYGNNTPIPSELGNQGWYDNLSFVSSGFFSTDISGQFSENYIIPEVTVSNLDMLFNFSFPPFINYSEKIISSIKVFSGVSWAYSFDYNPREGDLYDLTGTLYSNTDPFLRISNRSINMYFNGSLTPDLTIMTAFDGSFSSNAFRLPDENGTASIRFELVNSAGKNISDVEFIFVENVPDPKGGGVELPPFLIFSLIFFPILIGIVVGLAVYGFFFYKKQEEGSRVVAIPLESKILNLKILKETGRLEESLSYLFNGIYMDLINAKYNRIRKENETIRDFAIISVKELKLTPSSIYPFIQQVEEIIYGKPYKITDKDFYKTCELFSPIYFQLTSHNFVLNF